MTIEGGARAGLIAPDEVTFAYIKGRPYAPKGADWDAAVGYWKSLATDPGATYDKSVVIDAAGIAPSVTWGTSPEDVVPRSEEHTSELQSLMRISYAVFCLKKNINKTKKRKKKNNHR